MFALYSSKRLALAGLCAAALALAGSAALAQDDPPPEVGRISYISGNVSVQPANSDQWGQAYPNLPVGPGDRIFTDSDGRAEVQVGQTYVRVGPNSDVTLVEDSSFSINFGVGQGSIRLHSFELWPRQLLDISTPNGNAEFGNSGDMRVDVLPSDGATVFTNLGQFADVTAAGDFRQDLGYGQSLELAGSNPVYPQWLQPNGPDDLDGWSQQRDQQLTRAVSFQYVSPEIPGAADLDANGDWDPQTEYGAIWYPRDVPADWEPYHYGHWVNNETWNWIWVEDEPWGYAPFHYGRWVRYRDRWGWVPGPPNVRPVWSPALVVFAGGVGGGGGVGLSVWFPLGPGEPYRPWYRCSPRYIDQVNITNIREAPRVHVQTTYVNIVNVTNVTNITYVNKTYVTAVRQDDFASGKSVRNVAVRVDPRDVQQVRPLAQPVVAPPAHVVVSRPVARPVPVSIQRPTLINQQGKQIAAKPGATPVAPPVRQTPQPRPLPGRTIVAAPARPVQNGPGGNQPGGAQGYQQRSNQPYTPNPGAIPRANPVGPVQNIQRPANPQQPTNPGYQQQERPNQPNNQQPNPPANQQPVRPNAPNQPNYQPERPNQPNNQPQERPNQPNNQQPNQPNRPNYQQPNPPANQQPVRPNPPNQPNYQQERPNQPNNQPQERPNQPNNQQPNQPNRPNYQQPNQPQERPAPPPPVQQTRPAPPPPQDRSAEQQQKPNTNNNKDQKKNDKKDDKKQKDDKKHD